MLHGLITLAYFSFEYFFFDAEACCRVSLNNLISATSALLFLAANFNEFPHFYVVPLFKGKYLIWYIQAM